MHSENNNYTVFDIIDEIDLRLHNLQGLCEIMIDNPLDKKQYDILLSYFQDELVKIKKVKKNFTKSLKS